MFKWGTREIQEKNVKQGGGREASWTVMLSGINSHCENRWWWVGKQFTWKTFLCLVCITLLFKNLPYIYIFSFLCIYWGRFSISHHLEKWKGMYISALWLCNCTSFPKPYVGFINKCCCFKPLSFGGTFFAVIDNTISVVRLFRWPDESKWRMHVTMMHLIYWNFGQKVSSFIDHAIL